MYSSYVYSMSFEIHTCMHTHMSVGVQSHMIVDLQLARSCCFRSSDVLMQCKVVFGGE